MTALSYAHGVSGVPLLGETIGAHFDRTVQRWGDRPALVSRQQGVCWTWHELGARVENFAAGLVAMGLRAGERVGIWSPNNAEWIVTQYATAKAGLREGQHCSIAPGFLRCLHQAALGTGTRLVSDRSPETMTATR